MLVGKQRKTVQHSTRNTHSEAAHGTEDGTSAGGCTQRGQEKLSPTNTAPQVASTTTADVTRLWKSKVTRNTTKEGEDPSKHSTLKGGRTMGCEPSLDGRSTSACGFVRPCSLLLGDPLSHYAGLTG